MPRIQAESQRWSGRHLTNEASSLCRLSRGAPGRRGAPEAGAEGSGNAGDNDAGEARLCDRCRQRQRLRRGSEQRRDEASAGDGVFKGTLLGGEAFRAEVESCLASAFH